MRVWVAALVACGCGRIGFDVSAGSDGAGGGDGATPVGTWSTPQPVPGLSSTRQDWAPGLSFDGKILVLGSTRDTGVWSQLYVATLSGTTWSTPVAIASLASTVIDSDPAWNATGTTLYFASNRVTDCRLYTSAYDGSFAPPVIVPGFESETAEGPTLSTDELELFYGFATPYEVHRATRASTTAAWTLDGPVTELNDATSRSGWPSLSQDGLTLYFESDRTGRAQIYRASRSLVGGPFSAPELVPELDDGGLSNNGDPDLSFDGKTMLFASDRGGLGLYDIYMSTLSN